jgi:hypothetical protein
MATKTVVCPECGAEAVPGRFACADCGALVAAVGAVPLRWRPSEDVESEDADGANGVGTGLEPGYEAPVAPSEPAEPVESVAEVVAEPAPAPDDDAPLAAAESAQIVPDAPSVLGIVEPAVDDDDDEDDDYEDDLDEPAAFDESAPLAAASAAVAPPPAADQSPAAALVAAAAPAWPPEGADRPLSRPAPRTPAGAYLSPSPTATVPASSSSAAAAAAAVGSAAPRAAAAGPAEPAAEGTPRASLSETLDAFGITEDVPRRLIGAGAAISGLGFLLPWASVLAGNGLGGSYWTRWGLAGPGHWIIVAALVALVLLALGGRSDRFRRVPVGPIAIVLAGLLIGVLWPYVFGGFDRFVGIWLVLAGTIVLGVGGILDVRRHDSEEPPV